MTDRPTDPGVPAGPDAAVPGAGTPGDDDGVAEDLEGGTPSVRAAGGGGGMVADRPGLAAPSGGGCDGGSAQRQLGLLVLGIGAVVLASMAGGMGALGRILEPPFPVGLLLAAAATLLGIVVVLRAAARIGAAHEDARELIRAVRLIFLAVGCFAAAAGWVIGSAVPIVAGLIIVGIDVIETTFLLLVTASRETAGIATHAGRAAGSGSAAPAEDR